MIMFMIWWCRGRSQTRTVNIRVWVIIETEYDSDAEWGRWRWNGIGCADGMVKAKNESARLRLNNIYISRSR